MFESLSVWIASIVGITVLTVLSDIIMPQGQTNKYVKSVLSVIVVFVLAQPLPILFDGKIQLTFTSESTSLEIDNSFVQFVSQSQNRQFEQNLQNTLEVQGFENVDVQVFFVEQKIDYVLLTFGDEVIFDNKQHSIENVDRLRSFVATYLDISNEKVIVQ